MKEDNSELQIDETCTITINETTSSAKKPKSQKKQLRQVIWKKKNLIITESQKAFHENHECPLEAQTLQTPYAFFSKFFPPSLIEYITEQSMLYSVEKNSGKIIEVNSSSVRKYIGIVLTMGYVGMDSIRDYWSKQYGLKEVMNTMPGKTFEKIKSILHFAPNAEAKPPGEDGFDRLHKIRPIMNELRKNFQSVPLEECLSIDEQICPTKKNSYLKQYVPSKPHKWGYKFYVLSGVSGFAYDFEMYSGQENDPKFRRSDEPDLGAAANNVVRLSRTVPDNCNHKLYFDNYFTSLDLLVYLAKRGIYSLGTIRRNRIPQNKMPTEAEMKKKGRGASEEMVTNVDGVDVSLVMWQDNKTVSLMSTLSGEQPISYAQRHDKTAKEKLTVRCPNLVKEYNKHMGGVDKLDSLLGRSHCKIKSRKWYFRIFYHLLDITIINSWIMFKKVHESKMKLKDFRASVAEAMCNLESQGSVKRGRPSSFDVERQIIAKKKRGNVSHLPVRDVRLDGVAHWPSHTGDRLRCKMPGCQSLSYIICQKCGVTLCLNKSKNCFEKFHTN